MESTNTKGSFGRWLFGGPTATTPTRPLPPIVTGAKVIDEVMGAIALDQSILLVGPRGSGKSYCIEEGIRQAQKRNVVGPAFFVQGNSEIPRDYLAEDDLVFKLVDGNVIPRIRSAPLFELARRNADGELLLDENSASWDLKGAPRFVLFLDEINRFSNGVLDSLLSILEEKKAVIGGKAVKIPVTICMTMNPPGYDATAKNLSPPLAARIGRTIRLSTPDLETLTDEIIVGKLDRALPNRWAARLDKNYEVNVPMRLMRSAALTTLCMWGSSYGTRPGLLYLTPGSVAQIAEVERRSPAARRAMQELGGFALFGPDGRAAADWVIAALGNAGVGAGRLNKPFEVDEQHFINTVVSAISGKLVDNFSSSSRPDLTIRKELAIRALAVEIFRNDRLQELIARHTDSADSPIWTQFEQYGFAKDITQRWLWRSRAAGDVPVRLILDQLKSSAPQQLSGNPHGEAVMTFFQLAAEEGAEPIKEIAYSRASALASVLATSLSDLLSSIPFISEYVGIESFHRTCDRAQISFDEREEVALKLDDVWRASGDAELKSEDASRLVQSQEGKADDVLIEMIRLGLKSMPPPAGKSAERGILSRIASFLGRNVDSEDSTAYRIRYNNLERIIGRTTDS
ncbi:MAG TPA: AAA family ATPase [Bryobacteraceae bacterium]